MILYKWMRFSKDISTFIVLFFVALMSPIGMAADSTAFDKLAFYYGDKPQLINQLRLYPTVVFEPKKGLNPRQFQAEDRKAFAYVPVGEVVSLQQFSKLMKRNWLLGRNSGWHSLVVDLANPEWQKFFLSEVITPLWNQGYKGFFLDTLDSYTLVVKKPDEVKQQQDGLVAVIKAIKNKYPDAELIANRGFEVMPQIKGLINGVVAESLFAGWDNRKKQYVNVTELERSKLLIELNAVKKLGLPITIIDYVPQSDPEKIKTVTNKISSLGFSPWVSNYKLTEINTPDLNKLPRKILILYDSQSSDQATRVNTITLATVNMPLNYLGYVTVLRDINNPLLRNLSPTEYAGIVALFAGNIIGKEQEIRDWFLTQINKKIPLVILNNFGFTENKSNLSAFGFSFPLMIHDAHTLKVIKRSPMIGYEILPAIKSTDFLPINLQQGTVLLRVADELGVTGDMAAITPWGGYVLDPYVAVETAKDSSRLVIDPFSFFKQALRLPDMPVPDTTTENGRRLMMVHIDGDGFVNRGQWYKGPYSGEIMRTEILAHYPIPTTVSIIQSEIYSNGLYPKSSKEAEQIARTIFALPYVEIGSHTFSHPFDWHKAEKYQGNKPNPYSLPVPHYHFDLKKEIVGSVDYINKELAPANKKTKIFLWSGDADINEQALAFTYQLGLRNLNGGGTLIDKYQSSLTGAVPLGAFFGNYFQVYAAIANDNDLADSYHEPFYSIIKVIDTFKMTDIPRRLKPIDIYFHFYTVSQIGGLKALQKIYDWSLAQSVMNVYASEYVDKVWDFNDLIVAKKDNGWLFLTDDKLRELRLNKGQGYPDLVNSENVIGYNMHNDHYYIHLGPGGKSLVRLTDKPSQLPYLVDANARVTHFKRDNNKLNFSLDGYLPLKFVLANMQHCDLWSEGKKVNPKSQQQDLENYELPKGAEHAFTIQCL